MAYDYRPLAQPDFLLLEAFLQPRTERAFFIRANMHRAGLDYAGQPYQAEYFGAFHQGVLVGVLAYTWMHSILIDALAPDILDGMMPWLKDRLIARAGKIEAVLGYAPLAARVMHCLNIPDHAMRRDLEEGLFQSLLQDDLVLRPDLVVRRACLDDLDLLAAWRVDFNIEALEATPGSDLEASARAEAARRIADQEFFILQKEGAPVAFCGISGQLADIIWYGPVWTPPEHRNQGFARQLIIGSIGIVRAERPKLRQAALIAGNPAAIKSYQAIGFNRISDWRLALFNEKYHWSE